MDILISGAGVAGPTAAYWLNQYGFKVTMVERAPALRTGGYIIDFWGAGYDVADRMDLLRNVSRKGYHVQEVRFVGKSGRPVAGFEVKNIARLLKNRFISLPRGDLAAAIFSKTSPSVETVFGDEIVGLRTQGDRIEALFRTGLSRKFDLVIGAGGLHSPVRSLLFGSEERFARYLGYKIAAFEVERYQRRDELVYVSYGRPGIQASRFALRNGNTLILLVVADENPEIPESSEGQKAYLRSRFGKAGWECPQILAALDEQTDFYFDRASQIEMPRWSKDKAVLVGDAAFCPSLLAGEGTSLAMTAAYVLAGELSRANGDAALAFQRYEERLRPLMLRKQKMARQFASSFAPRTRLGVLLRNFFVNAMAIPGVANLAIGASLRDDFELPDYA